MNPVILRIRISIRFKLTYPTGPMITENLIYFGKRRGFYKTLKDLPVAPAPAVGFYLPPSIRRQMLDDKSPQTSVEGNPETCDVVARGHESFEVTGSALFVSTLSHPLWI